MLRTKAIINILIATSTVLLATRCGNNTTFRSNQAPVPQQVIEANSSDANANELSSKIVKIEIEPTPIRVAAGTSARFRILGILSDGSSQPLTNGFTIRVLDEGIATINGDEIFGRSVGETTLAVTMAHIAATASVTVSDATVQSLSLYLSSNVKHIDQMAEVELTALMSDGTKQPVTSGATWALSNPNIAQMQLLARGVQPSAPGFSLDHSEQKGIKSGSVKDDDQYSNKKEDDDRYVVKKGIKRLSWDVAKKVGLTKEDKLNTAQLITKALGTLDIAATYAGMKAKASLRIVPADLLSIQLKASPSTQVAKGNRMTFRVDGLFSDGKSRDVTSQTSLSFSQPGVFTPVATTPYLYLAAQTGSTTVQANLKDNPTNIPAAELGVRVSAAELRSIAIAADKSQLIVGESIVLRLFGTYSDGSVDNISNHSHLMWRSGASSSLAVSNAATSKGKITAVAPSSKTIISAKIGNSETLKDTIDIETIADDIKSITISPETATVFVGGSQNFVARGYRTIDKTPVNITETVVWSINDPAIAQISNAANTSGTAQGKAAGTATITARYMNSIDSNEASLTVVPVVLSAIAISPANPTVKIDETLNLKAKLTYNDGSEVDAAEALLNWSSAEDAIATVANSAGSKGRVTGVATGSVAISATHAATGVRATVNLVVPRPEFSSVKLRVSSDEVQESTLNLILAIDNSGSMAPHQESLAEKFNLVLSGIFDSDAGKVAYDLNVSLVDSSPLNYATNHAYIGVDANGNETKLTGQPVLNSGYVSFKRMSSYAATPLNNQVIAFKKGMNKDEFSALKDQVIDAITNLGTGGNPQERLLCNIVRRHNEIAASNPEAPLAILALSDENSEINIGCEESYIYNYTIETRNRTVECDDGDCYATYYGYGYYYYQFTFDAVDSVFTSADNSTVIPLKHYEYDCTGKSYCPTDDEGTCNDALIARLGSLSQFKPYGNFSNCRYQKRESYSTLSMQQYHFADSHTFDYANDYCDGPQPFRSGSMTYEEYVSTTYRRDTVPNSCKKAKSYKREQQLGWRGRRISSSTHFGINTVNGFIDWLKTDIGLGNLFFSAIFKDANSSCPGSVGNGYDAILKAIPAKNSSQASICSNSNYDQALKGLSQFVEEKASLQYIVELEQGDTVYSASTFDSNGTLIKTYMPDDGFVVTPVEGTLKWKIQFDEGTIGVDQSIEFKVKKA